MWLVLLEKQSWWAPLLAAKPDTAFGVAAAGTLALGYAVAVAYDTLEARWRKTNRGAMTSRRDKLKE